MEIIKLNDNEIEVTKTETKESKNTFNYEYLVSQKKDIQEHKDRDNIQRDKELAEINILLSECDKIGVTIKVIKVIK